MENINKYSDFIYLYNQGTQYQAFNILGSHTVTKNHHRSTSFRVYAPHAQFVSVVGMFNQWNKDKHPMTCHEGGIWDIDIEGVTTGEIYKYAVTDKKGKTVLKADPFAFYSQMRPETASVVADPFSYPWSDDDWMNQRMTQNSLEMPMNIYEVHLASWIEPLKDNKPIDMESVGNRLIAYCREMHYTHIEILPVTEYPLDDSWGYQVTGYYSLSGRFSSITGMQSFINACHENGLGVILDWVPGHFCPDEHGLALFDGTELYEKELHPNWGTYKFDFSRKSVWSFLISSAYFFARFYHIDGIRVDGVSSIIDFNFGKSDNYFFSKDINAISFLKQLNQTLHSDFKGFLTMAEDSSDFKGITGNPPDGFGFDYKWDMGWMHDTLNYYEKESHQRQKDHYSLTFAMVYHHYEKFILPFSHDEVVHGKKQLIDKMAGDYLTKFANLRTLLAYQMFHPGKKLLFMGIEIAQFMEWRYYESVEWFLLKYPIHNGFHEYVRALNRFYLDTPALYENDYSPYGFEWIDADNSVQSIYIFLRRSKTGKNSIIVINNSFNEYNNYKIGVPEKGIYEEVFSSNLELYGGTGYHNLKHIRSRDIPIHHRNHLIEIIVPPFSATVFEKIK
ncbi:MAG: 1,4-alpha-glucan branching protein GlgB [Clostridia bacterium]|nr:1,4-alpha-glucan branching protein GlgB [Clostridia bacterium]